MESLCHVDGHVINAILQGVVLQLGLQGMHLVAIGIGNFIGLQVHLASGLEIDEPIGACIVTELQFV